MIVMNCELIIEIESIFFEETGQPLPGVLKVLILGILKLWLMMNP